MISNDRIPHRAWAILIPAMITEAGIITLPGTLVRESGTWGWLAFLLGVLPAAINIVLLVFLLRRHKFMSLPELLQSLLGTFCSRFLLAAIGLILAYRLGRILYVTAELVSVQLLTMTPDWATLLVTFIVVIYLAIHGFEPIARFAAITVPFYYSVMLAMFLFALFRIDYSILFQPGQFSLPGLLRGAWATLLESEGYMMLLIFLPWTWKSERVLLPVLLGTGLAIMLAFILTVATIGVLDVVAAQLSWPTLHLVEIISLPGLLFERVEVFFFAVWILTVVTVSILTLFAAAYTLSHAATGRTFTIPFTLLAAALAGLFTQYPANATQFEHITQYLSLFHGLFEMFLPLLLWGLTLLRRGVRGN